MSVHSEMEFSAIRGTEHPSARRDMCCITPCPHTRLTVLCSLRDGNVIQLGQSIFYLFYVRCVDSVRPELIQLTQSPGACVCVIQRER